MPFGYEQEELDYVIKDIEKSIKRNLTEDEKKIATIAFQQGIGFGRANYNRELFS